jgi:hypothetical protein
MVLFAVSAAEGNSLAPAQARPPAQAVLALGTLLAGHFKHSLWLMTSVTVIDLYRRQHRRALLRC